jgi:hypothetical protein
VPLCCATALLAAKTAQKPLTSAVAQRSGLFFVAHTCSVSGVMVEFRYATLNANGNGAVLRYTHRYGDNVPPNEAQSGQMIDGLNILPLPTFHQ